MLLILEQESHGKVYLLDLCWAPLEVLGLKSCLECLMIAAGRRGTTVTLGRRVW